MTHTHIPTLCAVEGCGRPSRERGWCHMHYARWQRHGDPLVKKRAGAKDVHGGTHTRLYNTWKMMRSRCGNPNATRYDRYGGRGITVCAEWSTFVAFRTWALSHGYADDLTIDRVDNDGNYEPANCEWVTRSENSRRALAASQRALTAP